ncbi:alpha/beta hydrolase [Sphaerisporangium melleum]|uniref:Alpha/beta hydrolase n=1 Tax=Sphaerisporangium melleum TaxID=321316 RepID=A0A917R5C1_9ACTN|nr:alpha/beta fold hydrolase [Sphaerisporangium melleum]GGK89951.1 alpha/beta hydrolase [Sphaerisporangium melleum]GII72562.1 alpha/beta hydrolase [Sphaerisporangium melleum]
MRNTLGGVRPNRWIRRTYGRHAVAAALAAVTIAAFAVPAGAAAGTGSAAGAVRAAGGVVPAGSAERGALRWGGCDGVDAPELRCASLSVPLDHRHPRGRTISIAISRLPATDPARRRGVLLTTGGGPGGPGVPLPASLAPSLPAEVRAQYDLVGFDIRFVERSTPIGCGQAVEEPGGYWVRGATPGSFQADAGEARRYASGCLRAAGWALPHATTANAARDMDLIRAALGEEKISYLGGSYAGMLGATYAALFPGRVDRFVLDSPVNGADAWRAYELARTPAFEAGTAAFAAWTAERHAQYGLGATAGEVTGAVSGLIRRAGQAPIVLGGHAWTGSELGALLVAGIYDERAFGMVAAAFAAVAAGREPFVPFPIRPVPPEGVPGVPADNHTATNIAYRCGDGPWPRDPRAYLRDLAVYGERYPIFGPANANITPCAFWPPAQDAGVRPGPGRAPGVLVTVALRDVAVPPANGRAVAARIPGSRLVTIDAQTHAPFPYFGDACLNDAVNGFLATGRLPAADLAC